VSQVKRKHQYFVHNFNTSEFIFIFSGPEAGAAIIGGTGGHVTLNILVDPDPLTRGSAPGPRWGLCPQTPVSHHSEELAATAPKKL